MWSGSIDKQVNTFLEVMIGKTSGGLKRYHQEVQTGVVQGPGRFEFLDPDTVTVKGWFYNYSLNCMLHILLVEHIL